MRLQQRVSFAVKIALSSLDETKHHMTAENYTIIIIIIIVVVVVFQGLGLLACSGSEFIF
jgi:hypothetical protein